MGKLNDEIERYEEQMNAYRESIIQIHVDEINRKKDPDTTKEKEYIEQYKKSIKNIRIPMAEIQPKLDALYSKRDDYGRFPADIIGPLIAKVMSEIEHTKFVYKNIEYVGVQLVLDMFESIDDSLEGRVCMVTDKINLPYILEDYTEMGAFAMSPKTIFLATIDFEFPPYGYGGKDHDVQQIVTSDDGIAFYSPKYDIETKKYDYIYEMIDMLIDRKVENESLLEDPDAMGFAESDGNALLGIFPRTWLLEDSDYEEIANKIISKYKKGKPMALNRRKENE